MGVLTLFLPDIVATETLCDANHAASTRLSCSKGDGTAMVCVGVLIPTIVPRLTSTVVSGKSLIVLLSYPMTARWLKSVEWQAPPPVVFLYTVASIRPFSRSIKCVLNATFFATLVDKAAVN